MYDDGAVPMNSPETESSHRTPLRALAVVMEEPMRLALRELPLSPVSDRDVVVELEWTGISTGTERLLWTGRMPAFPGMGYPLVPGYECVGRVTRAGVDSGRRAGDFVFVPGASCYGEVRGLFGGAARRIVVSGERTIPVEAGWGDRAVLLALAATAHHAISGPVSESAGVGGRATPELIVGHGVLGRLLARLALLGGGDPVVWETNPVRRRGAEGYRVVDPGEDPRRDYRAIYDVSGDASNLDGLMARLAHGGELVLAGFYESRIAFDFPAAFMREARVRVAAEWKAGDLEHVAALVAAGQLSLDGLITHRVELSGSSFDAGSAYETAFRDPECLKMVLDWRACS